MDAPVDKLEPLKKVFVAATPNELVNTPSTKGAVAGFWQGMWHGFIFPFAFFISLFNKNVGLYETHNNGAWYNFGFFLGLSMIFSPKSGGMKIEKKK